MLRLDLVAVQQQGVRGFVIHDYSVIAIQNLAARRKNGRALDPVSFRCFAVNVRVLYLQFPEAGNQKDENGDRQVLKNRDLSRSRIRLIAQKAVRGKLLVPPVLALKNCHESCPGVQAKRRPLTSFYRALQTTE